MFDDHELELTLVAGQRWARERDIPDAVGWRDLVHAVPETLAVVHARLSGDLAPARTHSLPLPKGIAGELRGITVADPFDEVVFRALVGRAAAAIDSSLGDEVASYRVETSGPGWTVRDYRYANRLRTAELVDRITAPSFRGLGTLDIRKYYPSIAPERLGGVLDAVGVDAVVADAVEEYLTAWGELWGVQGVPIGPEASGLLGNVYLVSVDRALRAAGVEFSRYTDDYQLWLPSRSAWPAVQDTVVGAAAALGLALNPQKTRHLTTAHGALRALTNGDIDDLKVELGSDVEAGLRSAAHMFDVEAAEPVPDPKRLKFLLGVMRHRRHPHAIAVAEARPELLQADPKAWAKYFEIMHGDGLLDIDWVLEIATAPVTKETAAVAYHLLGVCTVRRVGIEHGRQLRDFACDNDRSWVPVRCAAAEAWSCSDGYKATIAADAALAVGDTQQRRALVLSMRRSPASPARDRALVKLHHTVPECRPSVRFVQETGDDLAA